MKQFCVTVSMAKRLIGKGMAALPEIQAVLKQGTLVILGGTTNGYVAEEILKALGQAEGFSRQGFRRGLTVAPGAEVIKADFAGDVVIHNGEIVEAGPAEGADRTRIGLMMAGHDDSERPAA